VMCSQVKKNALQNLCSERKIPTIENWVSATSGPLTVFYCEDCNHLKIDRYCYFLFIFVDSFSFFPADILANFVPSDVDAVLTTEASFNLEFGPRYR
jgi:hypothetical protein